MQAIRLKADKSGDTLIEVMFAFAILGALIGLAFTGIVSAHKSTTAALQRTQALEIAQYEAEALKMYRASLPWDSNSGPISNFLGSTVNKPINPICIVPKASESTPIKHWDVVATSTCNTNIANVSPGSSPNFSSLPAPSGGKNKVSIDLQCIVANAPTTTVGCSTADAVRATVTVLWTSAYNTQSSITNIVLVTKNQ